MTEPAQDLVRRLLSREGQALLIAVAGLAEDPRPQELASLRKSASPDLIALALKVARARRKAGLKFPGGERLYFTPELLEQASAHPPALHRARRLAPLGPVLDLGCGAGGDLTRLALAGAEPAGLDSDPLALALAAANLETLGLRAQLHLGRFPGTSLPAHRALFCDPARRAGDGGPRRRLAAANFSPRPKELAPLLAESPAWAIKWGPSLDLRHAALAGSEGPLAGLAPADYELELVSWRGELREAVLWGKEARSGHPRQATVLRGDLGDFETHVFRGDPEVPPPPCSPPGAWIIEPDPALIRSGLLAAFAREKGLTLLAPRIAYLGAGAPLASPFARSWPLLEDLSFSLKRLQEALDRHDAGDLVLKKRGFPLDPEELRPRLKLRGARRLTVLIYRTLRGRRACICGPEAGLAGETRYPAEHPRNS